MYEPLSSGNIENSERSNDHFIISERSDSGVGIDEKEQSKVFEKFYRVDGSLNYKVQGTGIGLSIVKDLVQLHNGTIDLESSLKKGSKFILTFNRKVI